MLFLISLLIIGSHFKNEKPKIFIKEALIVFREPLKTSILIEIQG